MLGVTTLPVFTDSGNDNSCVASGNSNSSNVDICKNDNGIAIDNASSGNNSSIVSNIACNTIPIVNVPMLMMRWI